MINQELEQLYEEFYGGRRKDIVACGVVDEEVYLQAKPKIVFVLREPHTEETGFTIPNGLRRQVEKGLCGKPLEQGWMYTWRQAGVWAYAILYGFDSYKKLREDICVVKGLQAIGMTNLKKTGGGATSNLRSIRESASRELDLWRNELLVMSPDLIICGNTYHEVVNGLGIKEKPLLKHDNTPYYYSEWKLGDKVIVILDFWHPNNRKSRNKNLAILRELIGRLRGLGYDLSSDS
jgi:hypothetical protein